MSVTLLLNVRHKKTDPLDRLLLKKHSCNVFPRRKKAVRLNSPPFCLDELSQGGYPYSSRGVAAIKYNSKLLLFIAQVNNRYFY